MLNIRQHGLEPPTRSVELEYCKVPRRRIKEVRKEIRSHDLGFTDEKLQMDAKEIIAVTSLAVSEGNFDSLVEYTDEGELARLRKRYEELTPHERKFARMRAGEIAEVVWVETFLNAEEEVTFGMRAFGYHWIGFRHFKARNFFSAHYEIQRPLCEASDRYRVISARHLHGYYNFLI